MTEPETETKSGSPSAAIETSQLVASAAEETETAEVGGGEEVDEHQQEEVKEEDENEEEREEEEKEEEEKEEEAKEEEQQEEEGPEEEEAVVAKEEQEQLEKSTAPTKIIVQVGELEEDQAENVRSNNISNKEEGPIPRKVVKDGGKKEDEKTRQDNNKKVDEKKIEVTKVEARKAKVEPKVLKVEDKKVAVGKTVGGVPAAVEQNHEMRDRMENVEEEEEEEVEEEEEEEEVLEEKEEEDEEEEEEQEEEEEEEPEQQLQLQQVISKEEKMVVEEEEEEEDEEEDAGEEDELNERDGSPEEQLAFTRALKAFFKERRMDYKAPKFYGEELNILKLWRAVTSLGGYEQVTAGKLWRKVGEQFQPPKTCTTLSWSFRGFYEKALLEYERYQAGVSYPASSQPDGTISGTDSQAAMSPNTPSSQPSSTPASGSGRMRRDAATRAMHGWHAQRLGNGEAGDPVVKERPVPPSKKEKQLKNLVGSKRKETVSLVERAVKVARAKGSKGARSLSLDEVPTGKAAAAVPNKSSGMSKKGPKPERTKHVTKVNNMEPMRGLKLVITDDGPPADWVKINAYRTSEGYEIYALVPGLAREEVRIQCEEGGRVVICGSPEQPSNPWGVTAFRKVVNLPSKIDAHHTSAVVTLYGQLFVRVPFAHSFQ